MKKNNLFVACFSFCQIFILLFLTGCPPAPIVEYPNPTRRVKNQSTHYEQVQYQGQVSQKAQKELQQKYPEGFYKERQPVIPPDQQIRVGFRLFTSNPNRPDLAKMVTDTFINVFGQSNLFQVIEREQVGQLATELELNQSGLVNQDKAPDTGQFAATDVVITGAVNQGGGRAIDVRVLDVATSQVVLTERITPAVVNRQSAAMLARQLLSRMKDKYYKGK